MSVDDDFTPSEIKEARWIAAGLARRAAWDRGGVVTILDPLDLPKGSVLVLTDDHQLDGARVSELTLLDPPAPR